MIIGIGTDIVEVDRIEKVVERTSNFLNGAFTESERKYVDSKKNKYESIAGIFAAKEAVSKALGTGIRGFRLNDIEINYTELGKPIVSLNKKIVEKFGLGDYKMHVTISHTKKNAISFVVIEEVN